MKKGKNIRKRKDGRWEARSVIGRDVHGRLQYKYLYGNTYREAADKKAVFEKTHVPKASPLSSPDSPRFQDISILWLTNSKGNWKESTYAQYSECLQSQIIPRWGGKILAELDQSEYDAFIREYSHNLRANSLRMVNSILNGIVKYSVRSGYLDQIPFVTGRPSATEYYPQTEILSKNEIAQITEYCFHQPDLRALGILIALHEGARIGEICALRWKDIDFLEDGIHIRHTLQRIKNPDQTKDAPGTVLHFGLPKNNRERIIPIHWRIQGILQEKYRESQDDWFVIRDQKPCEPRSLTNYFKKILYILGIRNVRFHALRHTFASLCIESGVEIKALSEILGHTSVKITMDRYVHLTMHFKHEQLSKLQLP